MAVACPVAARIKMESPRKQTLLQNVALIGNKLCGTHNRFAPIKIQ